MGKNWHDPVVIAHNSRVYAAFVLVLAGVAAWDVLSTIRFDLSIIRGKRPWRWPMVLYYVTRICMILHIFAMAVNLNAIDEIPCQQVTWVSKVTDAIGTCCSSFILILRTRALWHQDVKVTVGLGALFCGQVAVWCQTFRYSIARWDPGRKVCAVIATAPRPLLVTVFAYTMIFDLIILILCVYRLTGSRRSGDLGALLFRDGVLYFCAAFGANLIQMIMASLALNPVMNIIALPFALVVSVIAATTVFRNVFTAYDAFSGDNYGSSSNGDSRLSDSCINRLGNPRIHLSRLSQSTSLRRMTNDISLGEYKGHHDRSGISVHKAVEIDVSPPHTRDSDDSKSRVL